MLQPTFSNVVMKKVEMQRSGPLYVPNHSDIFEVLAVGPDVKAVEAGQSVVLRGSSKSQEVNGEDYYIEHVSKVVAVVK